SRTVHPRVTRAQHRANSVVFPIGTLTAEAPTFRSLPIDGGREAPSFPRRTALPQGVGNAPRPVVEPVGSGGRVDRCADSATESTRKGKSPLKGKKSLDMGSSMIMDLRLDQGANPTGGSLRISERGNKSEIRRIYLPGKVTRRR